MSRRVSLFIICLLVAVCFGTSSAMAWGDGGDEGYGYGTHDWILQHAIVEAGSPAWIDVATAVYHTNDPDYKRMYPKDLNVDAQNDMWHVFQESGSGRGGPQAAADYYLKILTSLATSDTEEASIQLGIMSHYYDDPTQPFHTTRDAQKHQQEHSDYESEVDGATYKYGMSTGWLSPRSPKKVTDVRANAISAAYYARSKYVTLRDKYKKGNLKSNSTVNAITGDVLNRAVNDLADIIRSIPSGSGVSKPPAKMITSISRRYTGPKRGLHISVKCVDAKGNKLEGIPVDFYWPTKSGGTSKQSVYSQGDGVATTWYWVPTGMPLMKPYTVQIHTSSVGTQTATSSWFMVTPHLAAGSKGIKTTVSSHAPKRNTVVSARTVVHASNGHAVAGLNCTFIWTFKSHKVTVNTKTDSSGVARSSMNIGAAAKGYRVHVRAQVYSDTHHRSSTASFVPK